MDITIPAGSAPPTVSASPHSSSAGAEGRLTLDEIEDRLSAVYVRHEVDRRTGGAHRRSPGREGTSRQALPAASRAADARRDRHGAGGADHRAVGLWPIAPLFWLAMSLAGHARIRGLAVGGRRLCHNDHMWHNAYRFFYGIRIPAPVIA
jgi:hypothetical protein